MVKLYNEAAQSSGLTVEQANAVVGDLFAVNVPPELNTPEFHDFDVAVIGLGFHHFEDPILALRRLTERVKPGTGVVVIVDFLPFEHGDQHAHGSGGMGEMQRTIKHAGFTSDGMKRLFVNSGLEDFKFDVLPEPAVMELKDGVKKRTIFIAKGRRQPTAWGKFVNWMGSMQDYMGPQLGPRTPANAGSASNRFTPGGYEPRGS